MVTATGLKRPTQSVRDRETGRYTNISNFKGFGDKEILQISHSVPSATVLYTLSAENSGHKFPTRVVKLTSLARILLFERPLRFVIAVSLRLTRHHVSAAGLASNRQPALSILHSNQTFAANAAVRKSSLSKFTPIKT